MSFTDGTQEKDPERYYTDETVLGRAFIPRDGVQVTGDIVIRYEKHPWLEGFELDGIKTSLPKRQGFGSKGARGFVKSLSSIYSRAYDDYYRFGGDEAFRAEEYFAEVTEHFARTAEGGSRTKLIRMFIGFTENMWREGTEEMYRIAMDVMIPGILRSTELSKALHENTTDEFRQYLAHARET